MIKKRHLSSLKKDFIDIKSLCQGLKTNARATYQCLVNKMFNEQISKTMDIYIDDMLIKSFQANDHMEHLRKTF